MGPLQVLALRVRVDLGDNEGVLHAYQIFKTGASPPDAV